MGLAGAAAYVALLVFVGRDLFRRYRLTRTETSLDRELISSSARSAWPTCGSACSRTSSPRSSRVAWSRCSRASCSTHRPPTSDDSSGHHVRYPLAVASCRRPERGRVPRLGNRHRNRATHQPRARRHGPGQHGRSHRSAAVAHVGDLARCALRVGDAGAHAPHPGVDRRRLAPVRHGRGSGLRVRMVRVTVAARRAPAHHGDLVPPRPDRRAPVDTRDQRDRHANHARRWELALVARPEPSAAVDHRRPVRRGAVRWGSPFRRRWPAG